MKLLIVVMHKLTTYGPPLAQPQPISFSTFRQMTGMARSTVACGLEALESKGIIEVSGDGRGNRLRHGRKTNHYRLAPVDQWKVGDNAFITLGSPTSRSADSLASRTGVVRPTGLQVDAPSIEKVENERDKTDTPHPSRPGLNGGDLVLSQRSDLDLFPKASLVKVDHHRQGAHEQLASDSGEDPRRNGSQLLALFPPRLSDVP